MQSQNPVYFDDLCCISQLSKEYRRTNIEADENAEKAQSDRITDIDRSQISPILGFTFDKRPVQDELNQMAKVFKEGPEFRSLVIEIREMEKAGADVTAGTIEGWKKRLEDLKTQLKETGIDRVVEEANRQLESWKQEHK